MNFLNDIIFILSLSLVFLYHWNGLKSSNRLEDIELTLEAATELHLQYLISQSSTSTRSSLLSLDRYYREAFFQGLPITEFFQELTQLFRQSQILIEDKYRLSFALIFRSILIIGFCLTARIGFHLWRPHAFDSECVCIDMAALVSALCLTLLFHRLVGAWYPKFWFWDKQFTHDAEVWMQMRLLQLFPISSTYIKTWNLIQERELLSGEDLSESKKELMHLWRHSREKQQRQNLQLFEDALPLLELLGLGLPALLLLFAPALSLLSA